MAHKEFSHSSQHLFIYYKKKNAEEARFSIVASVIQSKEIGVPTKQGSCICKTCSFSLSQAEEILSRVLVGHACRRVARKMYGEKDFHSRQSQMAENTSGKPTRLELSCFRYVLFKFNSIKQARKLIKLFLYQFPLLIYFQPQHEINLRPFDRNFLRSIHICF